MTLADLLGVPRPSVAELLMEPGASDLQCKWLSSDSRWLS